MLLYVNSYKGIAHDEQLQLPCCHFCVAEVTYRTQFEIIQHYVITYVNSVVCWVLSRRYISALINTDCWSRVSTLPLAVLFTRIYLTFCKCKVQKLFIVLTVLKFILYSQC
jgi:hypothetical protein